MLNYISQLEHILGRGGIAAHLPNAYLLVVGAGWSTVLCPSAKAAMVPAGSGCGVTTGGDLLPSWWLLKASLELGPRSLGLGSSSLKRAWRRFCPVLSAANWWERSAISCQSVASVGVDQHQRAT